MNFNQLNGFIFDSESGKIGAVASVDFILQTISILTDDDEILATKLANATFLEKIGYIGKNGIINHDVLATADGKLYEIELISDTEVQLHLLDKKLNRVETGEIIAKTDLPVLEPYVTLVGNINVLEPENAVDFNIKVVRITRDGFIEFYYACNNIENEEVDLIKVVFVGSHLLEEENYERITMTYDEYLAEVESGYIIETSPQALQNYVTGLMYGKSKPHAEQEQVEKENDTDEGTDEDDFYDDSEEYCNECGGTLDSCDCGDEW